MKGIRRRGGNWRKIVPALITGLGLAAPNVSVMPSGQQAVQQGQQSSKEQATAPVAQVPQARVAVDMRSFFGGYSRHPVWVGRAKRGYKRKFGTRARWDYRR